MQIAVTGATGFIGRILIARLLADGFGVTVLSRDAGRARSLFPKATVSSFDGTAPVLAQTLTGCEAIIHLAGEPIAQRWTRLRKERIFRSRVERTRILAEAAVGAKTVKTFLTASAVGFYGARGAEVITEEAPPGTDFQAQVCSAWERAASIAEEHGIRTVRLRTGIVLHPEGGALARMLLPFRIGLGAVVGPGDQYVSWIHRDDVVNLLAHLLQHPVEGAVNATAPNPVTNTELSSALARVLGRPCFLRLPGPFLRLVFGEMSSLLIQGQRVIPKRAIESGFQFRFPSLEPALKNLLKR